MKEEFSKNTYDNKYLEFIDYFERIWLKKTFRVGDVNINTAQLIDYFTFYDNIKNQPNHRFFATNNAVEGYNNRMKLKFGKEKGPIQFWIDVMVKEMEY